MRFDDCRVELLPTSRAVPRLIGFGGGLMRLGWLPGQASIFVLFAADIAAGAPAGIFFARRWGGSLRIATCKKGVPALGVTSWTDVILL